MKKILIVGAVSAIAMACARQWAAQGSEFFLVARNQEKLQQTAADLLARGASGVTVHLMDATDLEKHSTMLESCTDALHQIDIVLIAHGTLPDQKACESDVDLTLREFANNATSVISLMTILGNQLEKQRCGTLAVISSVAGDRGRPSNYVYGTAKAAVSTFCEGIRSRLFKVGVHVIDIRPGFVDTPMTQGLPLPSMLVVKPEQVAQKIVKGIEDKVDVLYAPAFWRLIMMVIKMVPRLIFKRINI